jgi:signal transduction histidine kinase
VAAWEDGTLSDGYRIGPCWAGFQEVAVPVVVHDHVVAVAMTGQMLRAERGQLDELLDVDGLCAEYPTLREKRDGLNAQRAGLEAARKPFVEGRGAPEPWTRVFVNSSELERRARVFSGLMAEVAAVAQGRYEQRRLRNEQLFRTYLFGRLDAATATGTPTDAATGDLLAEMARFWAIRHVALFTGSDIDDVMYAQADSHGQNWTRKTEGRLEMCLARRPFLQQVFAQNHRSPTPGEPYARTRAEAELRRVAAALFDEHVTWVFCAVYVTESRRIAFVFSGRDDRQVSGLPNRRRGGLSEIARSMIADTCHMVAERLREIWHVDDIRDQATVVGHEIRNSLAIISQPLGTLQQRATQAESDPAQTQSGRSLAAAARRTSKAARMGLKAALLPLERLRYARGLPRDRTTVQLGAVDLVEVVTSQREFFEYRWRGPSGGDAAGSAGTGWQEDFSNTTHRLVKAEAELLDLAVRNLLDNAFKYSFPGRNVEISVRTDSEQGCDVLQIVNLGPVIDDDEIGRLGLRGYRGRHARLRKDVASEGSGLGLYLVSQIVRLLGGEFRIASDIPRGRTTAILSLPLWRPPDAQ